MSKLQCHGAIEELQDYIAANANLGYTVGTNFVIGDVLDLATLQETEAIDLTMFDEGGENLPSGRRWHMRRSVRFIFKGTFGQGAVNNAWKFVDWLGTRRAFSTTSYRVLWEENSKLPSVVGATRSGTYLADVVSSFLLFTKTG